MPTLTFTAGNDVYDVDATGTYDLTFLAGDDSLTTRHGSATTTASMGDGNDVMSHRAGTASVNGDAGADRFEVYASGLTADGGADADLFNIRGGLGLSLSGGLGNDRFNFYGASGSILLHGNDGNDDFFGYYKAISGNIYGDAGADYFVGFGNFDGQSVTLLGGIGNDIYRAHHVSSATFLELDGEGIDSVQVARGMSFTLPANIENISVQGFHGSTTGASALTGNALNNTINAHANAETIFGQGGNDRIAAKGGADLVWGGDGNDYLDGGDGDDTLHGEAGNDTLNGRAGADTMAGGEGDDVYYVDNSSDVLIELGGAGTDLVRASVNYVMSDNVENGNVSGSGNVTLTGNFSDNILNGGTGDNTLYGEGGNDTLRGGQGIDFLHGGFGDDLLIGGEGGDHLMGEGGADILNGGEGNDSMQAGDGNDTIYAGPGQDYLHGGTGSDLYIFESISDSLPGASDYVSSFSSVAGIDTLDLSAIDANTNIAGDQAFTIRYGGNPTGNAGDLWWIQNEFGILYWYGDVNGDSIADFEFRMFNEPTAGTVWFSDFIL